MLLRQLPCVRLMLIQFRYASASKLISLSNFVRLNDDVGRVQRLEISASNFSAARVDVSSKYSFVRR